MHRSYSSFRDYADVVHAVLLPRCHNEPSNLTLKEIHDMLDLIANEDTTGRWFYYKNNLIYCDQFSISL